MLIHFRSKAESDLLVVRKLNNEDSKRKLESWEENQNWI